MAHVRHARADVSRSADAGFAVRLVNTTAVQQYSGLKHSDDWHDAFWLAHLMRLGIRGRRTSIEWPALADEYVTMSVAATRTVIDRLGEQIEELERMLLWLVKPTPMYRLLNTWSASAPCWP
jgi:hypothetical protein